MHFLNVLYPTILALFALSPKLSQAAKSTKVPKDAILLSQVKTLTLRAGAQTSHRRVPAVPQLSCAGPGCKYYKVDVMRCVNAGSGYDQEDIEWSCTASLPEEFKLGSTDVACEGYSSRDDPYVLKGSCGVEYRLLLTEKGEEKYGRGGWGGGNNGEGWNWGTILFVLIFVAIFAWIVYAACTAPRDAAAPRDPRQPRGWGGGGWGPGGGGGGGPGGPYDPPPPYPGNKPSGQQEGWRPGFWTGAGLGAGAGYLAGQRGREREPLFQQPQRGNSWFGGGNDNNRYQAPHGRSGSSSARHESTGFGSTSRR